MAKRPWKAMAVVALVAAYVVTSQRGLWSTAVFIKTLGAGWTIILMARVVWATLLYPNFFSPLRHLPEPTGNSFLNGQWKRIAAEPSGRPMIDWVNSIPNEGLIRYKGLLNEERVLPTSPKALAEVLVTKNYDFAKPGRFRAIISRVLGVGLVLAEGEEHKAQRRMLSPAFAFRHVKNLVPVFWDKSREAVRAMTAQVDADAARGSGAAGKDGSATVGPRTAVLEVGGWASRATLDIIGVAGLGRDFGAIRDPNTELVQVYNTLFQPSRQSQLLGLLQMFLPGWFLTRLPIRRNGDIHEASRFIRATCRDLIRSKKEQLLSVKQKAAAASLGGGNEGDDDDAAAAGPGDHLDILSVALESGGFSDEQLVDQLMTFLAAGHETTATSMTWAIYMLCRYPEVQRRLRAEVRARLPSPDEVGGGGATVTSADIDRMPYLNAVCHEVLRYYGPVPLTLREAVRDTSILGQFVPRGTRVMVVPWAINKSTALWGPDAMTFNPERWLTAEGGNDSDHDGSSSSKVLNGNGGAASNFAFMTFLHGPRSCIGMGFAKAEFAVLLAAWIGRFEFRLYNEEDADEDKVDIKGGVTARPARGMQVYARVVDGW